MAERENNRREAARLDRVHNFSPPIHHARRTTDERHHVASGARLLFTGDRLDDGQVVRSYTSNRRGGGMRRDPRGHGPWRDNRAAAWRCGGDCACHFILGGDLVTRGTQVRFISF
jgi:hypothetical protein